MLMRRWLARCAALLLALTGCQSAPPTPPDPYAGVVEAKILATVFITPTPSDQERLAAQAAAALAPTPARATPIPSPTPYVGIFLGDTGSADPIGPESAAVRFATTQPLTEATVTAQGCTIAPEARFGAAWRSETVVTTTLGCAGEPASQYTNAAFQLFERGIMLYIPTGDIWAIVPGSPSGQYWYVSAAPPAQPEGITAPEGLRVPTQGFGAVWAAVPGVRQALGFARTEEIQVTILVQRFIGGELIQDAGSGQTFALLGQSTSGVVYGPY
jgi:hypothetical protein